MDASKKTLAIAGTVVGTALVIWPLAVWLEVRKCERPKYRRLLTVGHLLRSFYDREPGIEIREYAPYVVAEVSVEAETMKKATEQGFRQVAGFIFGGNKKEEKIAMTAPVQSEFKPDAANGKNGENGKGEKIAMTSPVTTTQSGSGRYKVAFVMPSKFKSTSDLPKPNNPSVELIEVPAHTLAALSWRGYPRPNEEVVKRKEEELRQALEEAGISLTSATAGTRLYQYYPPFAPQWLRLQDVLLPVDKNSLPAGSDSSNKTKSS